MSTSDAVRVALREPRLSPLTGILALSCVLPASGCSELPRLASVDDLLRSWWPERLDFSNSAGLCHGVPAQRVSPWAQGAAAECGLVRPFGASGGSQRSLARNRRAPRCSPPWRRLLSRCCSTVV